MRLVWPAELRAGVGLLDRIHSGAPPVRSSRRTWVEQMAGQTLYDKLWDDHLIHQEDGGHCLIYIDRHLVHEVTSPQAFEGLRLAGRKLWRSSSVLAVPDHNVPTAARDREIEDPVAREQIAALERNCREHRLSFYDVNDPRQGIVHVIGPEQGATLPGMTVVCGDSHTSTHGAFATLAMGIGTSEVEHVLATQCLLARKADNMRVVLNGRLQAGVCAKDVALAIIGRIGTAGGTGHAIEYGGEAARALTMEGRMTLCNMTIEMGARAGMVAFDDVTADYLAERPGAPTGALWEQARTAWQQLRSDEDAVFAREVTMDVADVEPQVTWGTSPEMVVDVNARVPDPDTENDPVKADNMRRALDYMALRPGTAIRDIDLDKVFIGSCTNARIEDLREAAGVVRGKQVAANIDRAMVVPGSGQVKLQAEHEGLDQVFLNAGFEWREPGCSMCLGMNDDRLQPGERCASTSNRNFEGRQGQGGRTHLVSPAMAAAAAIAGHFIDVRHLSQEH